MNRQTFLDAFDQIFDTPEGIEMLRRLILELAVRGRLTPQDPAVEPAASTVSSIAERRNRDVRRGRSNVTQSGTPGSEPFGLPTSWTWTRLGDVCQSRLGKMLDAQKNTGTMRPYLRNTNVQWGRFKLEDLKELRLEDDELAEYSLRDGDLLVVEGGEPGRCAIWQESLVDGAMVFQKALHRVRPEGGVSARFVAIALRNGIDSRRLQQLFTGSTIKHLTGERLKSFAIPLPPVDEQHRIAERVDQLMGFCDELEEQQAARTGARATVTDAVLHRIVGAETADDLCAAVDAFVSKLDLHLAPGDGDLAALKRLRQTIIDLAVQGRLAHQDHADEPAVELLDQIAVERDRLVRAKEIRNPKPVSNLELADTEFTAAPRGWMWQRLGSLILSSDSGWSPACVPSTRADEGQWAVLKVSAVSWGNFRAGEHKLLMPGLDPRPQIEVKDGDFIMSRANTVDLVGRSVVTSGPPPRLMLSDKHVRLRFRDRITAEFANLVNGSSRARSYYGAVATGTSDSMRNITRDQILALPVAVPPLCEQARIVSRVSRLNAICDQLEKHLQAAEALRGDLAASVIAHATPQREAGID